MLLTLWCVFVLAFVGGIAGKLWLRSWGPVQPKIFKVPSVSMLPAFGSGDVLVSIMYTWQSPRVERGDVVLHVRPSQGRLYFVSRVVGLPGEKIQVKEGLLHINDVPVTRQEVDRFITDAPGDRPSSATQYEESFPEGGRHLIIEDDGNEGLYDNTDVIEVPEGHVFVMGDNRDNSSDSRQRSVGPIPLGDIKGYPVLIWTPRLGTVRRVPH